MNTFWIIISLWGSNLETGNEAINVQPKEYENFIEVPAEGGGVNIYYGNIVFNSQEECESALVRMGIEKNYEVKKAFDPPHHLFLSGSSKNIILQDRCLRLDIRKDR